MPKVKKDKEAMQKRGDILFNLRKKRNVKQSTVADILGISQQAYLKYEHGDADPTIDALIILSDFYNVSIECLLGLEKIKEPDVLTRLAQEFNLNELEKVIVQAYIAISPKERSKFIETIANFAKSEETSQQVSEQPQIVQQSEPVLIQQVPQIESTQSQWRITARRIDGQYESRLATPEEVEKLKQLENDPEPDF